MRTLTSQADVGLPAMSRRRYRLQMPTFWQRPKEQWRGGKTGVKTMMTIKRVFRWSGLFSQRKYVFTVHDSTHIKVVRLGQNGSQCSFIYMQDFLCPLPVQYLHFTFLFWTEHFRLKLGGTVAFICFRSGSVSREDDVAINVLVLPNKLHITFGSALVLDDRGDIAQICYLARWETDMLLIVSSRT